MTEEKRCPECGMLMVKRYGPQRVQHLRRYSWWCANHPDEDGEVHLERASTPEELLLRMWREKNLRQAGVEGKIARFRLEGRPL